MYSVDKWYTGVMNVGDSIRWIPEEPEQKNRLYEPGTFVRFITPKYESNSMEWSL